MIVGEVTLAILSQLGEKYTRFSTISEAMRSIEFWRTKSGIPGVVACVVIFPSPNPLVVRGSSYCNRKGLAAKMFKVRRFCIDLD